VFSNSRFLVCFQIAEDSVVGHLTNLLETSLPNDNFKITQCSIKECFTNLILAGKKIYQVVLIKITLLRETIRFYFFFCRTSMYKLLLVALKIEKRPENYNNFKNSKRQRKNSI